MAELVQRFFLAAAVALPLAFNLAFTLAGAGAAPRVEQIGGGLYAYISNSDRSANSAFLIGQHGILVVDTGLDAPEGRKLLAEIRKLSPLPIQFIVNTHYHPDHQGANGVFGSSAMVISSPFTRQRSLEMLNEIQHSQPQDRAELPTIDDFRLASETVTQQLTIYIDDDPVQIIAPGPGHTLGDVYVYFPNQRSVAMGDLFLNRASPSMDDGSAANWIHTLGTILSLPAEHFVPGHFEVATRGDVTRFRDYLGDLYSQVQRLRNSGDTLEQIKKQIDTRKYADFRQYPQYNATFAGNAEAIYQQLEQPLH